MVRTPVIDEIAQKIPVTIELVLLSLVFAVIIAFPIGIYSAIRQDTVGDYVWRSFATLLICVLPFWVGLLVVVYSSLLFHWSPPLIYVPLFKNPVENLSIMIIPALIQAMFLVGINMRMLRTMMIEVLRQDYIRTAWAKGLRERTVVLRHAVKNALIPVVTLTGTTLVAVIGGNVIVERIFNLPGLGLLHVALCRRQRLYHGCRSNARFCRCCSIDKSGGGPDLCLVRSQNSLPNQKRVN